MDIFFGRDPAISRLHLIVVDYTIIDHGDHPGLRRTARRWRLSTCRTIIQRRMIIIIIMISSSFVKRQSSGQRDRGICSCTACVSYNGGYCARDASTGGSPSITMSDSGVQHPVVCVLYTLLLLLLGTPCARSVTS